MQPVRSAHPAGTIGVISGDLARYPAFYTSLMNLQVPNGSSWQWVRGNGIAANRNIIVREMQGAWLLFLDDDQTFEPDILMQLLHRNVPIVQPLVSTRKPPFRPYAYYEDGSTGGFQSYTWDDLPPGGLFACDAVGTGGTLIRREVLDAIVDPWFEEGQVHKEALGEDLSFMRKARAKGFGAAVDLDNRMGHMTTCEVWPAQADHRVWCVDLDLYHGVRIRVSTDVGKNAPTV